MNRPELIQRILTTTRTDELYRIRKLGLSEAPMAIKLGERYVQHPEHLAPFLNAMYLGFETSEMAKMVKELGFELAWLDPELEELPWLQGASGTADASFDHLNFLQKMVSAFYLAHGECEAAAREISLWMGQSPMFMAAGLVIDSPHTEATEALNQVSSGTASLSACLSSIKQMQMMSETTDTLIDMSHLPDKSIETFLERSGGLSSDMIRGRFGRNYFWQTLLLRTNLNPNTTARKLFFANKAPWEPDHRPAILLSLDSYVMSDSLSYYNTNSLYEAMLEEGLLSGLGDTLGEPAFAAMVLGSLTNGSSIRFSIEDSVRVERVYGKHPHLHRLFHALTSDPASIYERVMHSQMRAAPDNLPLSQFLVWGLLGKMDKVEQVVSPAVARQYCTYVLQQFQTFKFAPQGAIAELDPLYEEINASMRALMPLLEPFLDYQALARLGEQHREDLVLWGLDVHKLKVDREAIMTKRLEMDLGM
ncbi:hypothetical protein RBE51_17890 [Pseudomonas taiwanensis]|uniref:hypothetical protein n=1 Tax=Pseudomonas taiwanensis TaxID=470150 RepID=UPI0028DEE43C|nr:hypothetical protein [Pseudomonas taiwanensis]MDT8924683.1 hypothetical protein [Pseudomonas taiwanensis]